MLMLIFFFSLSFFPPPAAVVTVSCCFFHFYSLFRPDHTRNSPARRSEVLLCEDLADELL